RVDEILAGACIATIYKSSWTGFARRTTVSASFAAILWFVSANYYSEWLQYLRPYGTACFLAAVLCLGESSFVRLLSSRLIRYIAAISYALYVVHPLTLYEWFNQGTVVERYLFKRPISFLMTFALAHISTFHWERLWLQAGRDWIKTRRARVAKSTV